MDNTTLIAIPSRGRADWLANRTRSTLKQIVDLKPKLFVRRDDDTVAYKKYVEKLDAVDTLQIYDGENILYYSHTCDYIIDFAIRCGYEKLVVIDDDLVFYVPNSILSPDDDKHSMVSGEQLASLFSHVINLVDDKMPVASLPQMMTRSNAKGKILGYCKKLSACCIYDLGFFEKHPEYRFSCPKEVESFCDYNITLRLLTDGYLNVHLNTLFFTTIMNNPGGCLNYRTLEMQNSGVDYLCKMFSAYTKSYMKKGWADDKEIMRKGIKVQWLKSFNKELFRERFGIKADDFMKQKTHEYELVYRDFVKHQRALKGV